MSLYRRLLILLAFFGLNGSLLSQGGIIWEEATPICDPNATDTFVSLPTVDEYDRDLYPASIEPCNNYFSFNLNNPAWYTIVATDNTISMDISIANCVGGGHGIGVQYALVEVIDGVPVPVNCNSNANIGNNNNFSTDDLIIGNTYYLVLDGFAESTCDYSITNTSGFDDPVITEQVTQIIVNDQANINSGCRRNGVVKISAVTASNSPVANANSYSWEVSSLSGNGFSQSFNTEANSIEIENIPPGDYQVVVQVGNACDAGTEYTLDFTVEENDFEFLTGETVCLEEFSEEYNPTNPDYRGGPLTGIPSNPTRDTFFVEVGTGLCPVIQVLHIDFVDGVNTTTRAVDTTTCDFDGVFINDIQYRPRAVGSLPYFVPLDGDCGGFIELTVTWLTLLGDIAFDECDTKGATLKYDPLGSSFESLEEFASYEWFREGEATPLSTDEIFEVQTSGEYSLRITLQEGNNPSCSFDFGPIGVNVNNLNSLDVECTNVTTGSIGIQWNEISGIDSYAIGVDGRILEDDLRSLDYTLNDINLGDEVNFFVFANSNDPNCQPLRDSITCQALDCPPIDIELREIGSTDIPDSISYCVGASGSDVTEFEVIVDGGSTSGVGRWIIRGGGQLEGDRSANTITFDPNLNDAGEYLLGYQYVDGDCETSLDRDLEVYIEVVIPPISTDLDRIGRTEFEDGICVGEELDFRYIGNAGRTAIPIFTGDINIDNLSGSLDDRFTVTFNTPGTKTFDFMITDDNGCDSPIETYTIEVGEPLEPQAVLCDSPPEGLRFDWPDQPCVQEYRVWIDGNRQSPDITTSEFIYTQAVIGSTYEIEVVAVSDCGCGTTNFVAMPCTYEPAQVCGDVTIDLSLVAGDTLICLSGGLATVAELTATLTGADATGVEMWEVDTGSAAISPDGDFDPNIAGVGIHQVKYIWTEGECIYEDSISFVVSDAASVNFGLEVIDPMCFGDDMGVLNVMVSGIDIDPDFGVYINEDAIGSKDSSFMLSSGDHIVSVIDSLTGCDTLAQITIADGPDSLFLFPADEYFSRGDDNLAIDLDSAFASTIDSLQWTFNGVPICEDLVCGENFVLLPQESGTLCFEGYYSGMCFYSECAEVTYFPEFMAYIPNIISLANNEIESNKTFQVYTNDPNSVVTKMIVYDRWGNAVYQNSTEGTSMAWDPRVNNYTAGVYAYLIEITQADGKVSSFPGTLTVVE